MNMLIALGLLLLVLVAIGAVAYVIYLALQQYLELKKMEDAPAKGGPYDNNMMSLKVQAYERLILFLERIHPERLVFRVNKPGMSARFMQAEILKLIREEFDHNLAQQLYISNDAWDALTTAREETLKILNYAAEKTDASGTGLEFGTAIIETVGKLEKAPTEVAARILKNEFRKLVADSK